MEMDKRKIIVEEIEQWRRSKLLPEHYCDFLLNLYLDDPSIRSKSMLGVSSSSIKDSHWKVWMLIFSGIGIFAFIILNFNSFQIPMQIIVSTLIVLSCFMMGGVQRNKNVMASYLCTGIGCLLLLNVGFYLLQQHDVSTSMLIGFVALCGAIWIAIGITMRLPIIHFSGWVILTIIYGTILQNNIDDFDWIGLQLSWLPISIVLLWVGWLFHHQNKQIGTVLLIVGLFIWFFPDIYGLLFTEVSSGLLQMTLLVRIIVTGICLFVFRKKWIEWIT